MEWVVITAACVSVASAFFLGVASVLDVVSAQRSETFAVAACQPLSLVAWPQDQAPNEASPIVLLHTRTDLFPTAFVEQLYTTWDEETGTGASLPYGRWYAGTIGGF